MICGSAKVIAPSEKVKRKVMTLPTIELVEDKLGPAYGNFLQSSSKFPPLKTAIVHPWG